MDVLLIDNDKIISVNNIQTLPHIGEFYLRSNNLVLKIIRGPTPETVHEFTPNNAGRYYKAIIITRNI